MDTGQLIHLPAFTAREEELLAAIISIHNLVQPQKLTQRKRTFLYFSRIIRVIPSIIREAVLQRTTKVEVDNSDDRIFQPDLL